jgi:phosphoglycerate dehydrogenase-like enzyme
MPTLLILSHDADEYARRLQAAALPDLKITRDPASTDIVLGEPKLIREALPSLPRLRWAQSIYAGVEALLEPGLRRDYVLTNARGVFSELMSEFVFGYLLFLEKKIAQRMQAQASRIWQRTAPGMLRRKTIGFLGVGSIGAHLARTAKHFGMTVRGFTRQSEASPDVDQYFHGDDLLTFATGLDYLISILPHTKHTDKIVNAELLRALPPHAVFVNVGRGNAVDDQALIQALNEGRLAAAVLDVFTTEPLPEDHPFWRTPNLYMTFHTSALSYPEDLVGVFVENYHLYCAGKPLKYVVDFEKGY